ncbi:MAG: A/G-specific adenine glycosylase [Wolinella succinogenes]|uniref:A/G-specific adenine glycosylase n=1 Tax=Wolinella succinogenes TaxID=844 RepID=UPI0016BC18BA|nr:A/G-specific adenine glycosylase [Wolinella succinogenes]
MHQDAQTSLLLWYQANGRHHLPWRHPLHPYEILISEMMLQQTQVNTVLERFYYPFLERFPTLESIARAEESEILLAWRGLGYYSRARNLHALAKTCQQGLPKSVSELEGLPGIGTYTARAIACFGFRESVAILDGNIKRILSRFFALLGVGERELWRRAEEFLNPLAAFDHNQALLDVGALLCKPKNPLCQECPLSPWCKGKEDPLRYTPSKTRRYEELELFYGICIQEGRVAMVQSQERLYKGLWGFVPLLGAPLDSSSLGMIKHGYTKYKITAHLYEIRSLPGDSKPSWIPLGELEHLPISILAHKLWSCFLERSSLK